jgi:hypothetical protein
MVSIWLTRVNGGQGKFGMKKTSFAKRSRFSSNADSLGRGLLAILLDAGGPQAGQAVLIDGELPGKEFVNRQRVAAACFLEGEQAAADRGNDFGLPADNPPFGSGRGEVRNC